MIIVWVIESPSCTLHFQVSTAVELADSAEKSDDSFKGSNHRFQDVTDASHETQAVENKLDVMKPYSVSSTKPADLDLD